MNLFRCMCQPDPRRLKAGDIVVLKGPPGRPQIGVAPGTDYYPLYDNAGCPLHDPAQQAIAAQQRAALIVTTRRAGI